MSRVLVPKNQKEKPKKNNKAAEKLKQLEMNKDRYTEEEYLVLRDKLEDEIENQEKEYEYDEASEDDKQDDSDIEEAKQKIKKPQQEFQLVESVFPPTMIKTQGKNRLYWDWVIIICSVYQAFSVPLDIAFEPDIFNSPQFRTFDSIVDLIFVLDIIFKFRTTFIDPISGEEIMDSMLIAMKYIKSYNFYVDVLSTIPFDDLVGGGKTVQLLGFLKLFRFFRISTVIMNLNSSQEVKALLKVIYLVGQMFIYIHVMACIWFSVISQDEEWIANKDFIWFGNPQIYDIFTTTSGTRQYFTSFYTAYYLFGVGEVTPRTQTEVIVAIPILIISSIMNGLIIGNMALYISELQKKQSDF